MKCVKFSDVFEIMYYQQTQFAGVDWEQEARDRTRFGMRIKSIEKILLPVLRERFVNCKLGVEPVIDMSKDKESIVYE